MRFFNLLTLVIAATSSATATSGHDKDDISSIAVSSSIDVAGKGENSLSSPSSSSVSAVRPGLVEDLLANESEIKPISIASPVASGPASLPHASVVDSDQDLVGAESEHRFSLSKLRHPFRNIPNLIQNNRFLNGAASILAAGSHLSPQIRQPPPPNFRPHGGRGPLGVFNRHPQQQQPMGGPLGGPQIRPSMFKAVNIPAPQLNANGPRPGSPGGSPLPQASLIGSPFMNGQRQPIIKNEGGIVHLDDTNDEMANNIADMLSNDDGTDLSNDFDQHQNPNNDIWLSQKPDLAKIIHLDVKCEKNVMKVSVEFDRPYNGMIFSKGHFSHPNCIHLPAGSGRSHLNFDVRTDSCGTTGNMLNNALTIPGQTSGNYFENTVIFQYDPFVQEAWDQARKLRCTWHDQYEKAVSFRPFPVDMVDVVRADFAGDNVGCWMQIQVGRGPWASEVAGIVKIGQTMTMVLAIKDEENKFDMIVRNCVAHDGKRPPIELVDQNGCITRPKLMSKFTKIKNFGTSASVLSYAHFQAFKFPDSMEVHFQCTIQICKHKCPEQCDAAGQQGVHYINHQISGTFNTGSSSSSSSSSLSSSSSSSSSSLPSLSSLSSLPLSLSKSSIDSSSLYIPGSQIDDSVETRIDLARPREITKRDISDAIKAKEVGVEKIIRVVSPGDLSFATSDKLTSGEDVKVRENVDDFSIESAKGWLSGKIMNEKICMSSVNFVVCFAVLLGLLVLSFTCSIVICCRRRSNNYKSAKELMTSPINPNAYHTLSGRNSTQSMMMNGHSQFGATSAFIGSSSVLSPRAQASTGANWSRSTSDMYHS